MDFAGPEFWDTWYRNNAEKKRMSAIDWYEGYTGIKPYLDRWVRSRLATQDSCCLLVGCGNSPMAEEMIADGYCKEEKEDQKENTEGEESEQEKKAKEGGRIVNIDFSETVIAEMKAKYPPHPSIEYHIADACDLASLFPQDSSIDVIIDKGCLDSMFCSASSHQVVNSFFCEMRRILKPSTSSTTSSEGGGLFIVVSANEHTESYMTSFGWKIIAKETLKRLEPPNETYAPREDYQFFVATKPSSS